MAINFQGSGGALVIILGKVGNKNYLLVYLCKWA